MVCITDISGCVVYIRFNDYSYMPLLVPAERRRFVTQWIGGMWGDIEFIPPKTLRWYDGAEIMYQVVLSK